MTPPCKELTDNVADNFAKSLPEMASSTSYCKVSSKLLGEETLKATVQTPIYNYYHQYDAKPY